MTKPAKETAASPRIRSIGERDLAGELRASTDVLAKLERGALLEAPRERAAIRKYREDLRDLSTQATQPPETGASN